jgi:predicted permease
VILAFALGIGANSTVYRVIDRLLLRPPAQLREPEQLRLVAAESRSKPEGPPDVNPIRSYPELTDYRRARAVAGVAGFNYATHELTVKRNGNGSRVRGLSVTGEYFNVVGARPELGRLLTPSDDRVGAAPAVVLSWGYWQREFGGSREVLGQTLDFGQGPHVIVGVLPRGFTGVQLATVDIWFPLSPYRFAIQGEGWDTRHTWQWLNIVVRLPAGVAAEPARGELDAMFRNIYRQELETGRYPRDLKLALVSLIPGESPLAPAEVGVTRWLVAVALVVLLIACINITNLLLARAVRGRRALGIRLALGVTRARLIGQTVVEVMMLALLGGVLALAVARLGSAFVQRALLPDFAWDALGSQDDVILVTLVLTVVAGLAAALLPVLQLMRPAVLASLRSGSGTGMSRGNVRLRGALVVAQVALSVLLLAGAALFVQSFRNATRWDLGIDLERGWFLTVDVEEDPQQAPIAVTGSRSRTDVFYERALNALRTVPGVEAAAASATAPFYNRHGMAVRVEGWDTLPGRAHVHAVMGDYFQALGLRTLAGRALTGADHAGTPSVAVLNRKMANTLFPGGALDRCLYLGKSTSCTRIVGVVEDAVIDGVGAEPQMQYYIAAVQHGEAPQLWGFPIRVSGTVPAGQVISAARAALARSDARIRWVEATAFADLVDTQMRLWRTGASLFTLFGVLALVVAVLGLYAVMAFDVSQRLRELGVRAALGASPRGLLRLVVNRSVLLAGSGALLGVGLALLFAPRLQELLFRVRARDALSLAVVSLALIAAAAAAAYLPGRRASRIDPLLALRSD